jgi:predicted nucleic acid-binding protein
MPYADTDFFLALAKEDDWLADQAAAILDEHRGDLRTGLPTFIELAYLADEYEIDLERATASILEIAETDVDGDVLFQACANKEAGLNVMDAFHAALARGQAVVSSDAAFEKIDLPRIALEAESGPD